MKAFGEPYYKIPCMQYLWCIAMPGRAAAVSVWKARYEKLFNAFIQEYPHGARWDQLAALTEELYERLCTILYPDNSDELAIAHKHFDTQRNYHQHASPGSMFMYKKGFLHDLHVNTEHHTWLGPRQEHYIDAQQLEAFMKRYMDAGKK